MLKGVIVTAAVVIGAAVAGPQVLTALVHAPRLPSATPAVATLVAPPGVVTLRAGSDGHFRTEALIFGKRVPMLVDTGATMVILSYEQGEALGLIRSGDRFDVAVSTANGRAAAKSVTLNNVRIGSIDMPGVSALVMTRGAMGGRGLSNLLGMSFLGRLSRMEAARDTLTLER